MKTLGDVLNLHAVVSALESAGQPCGPLLTERAWPYRRLPLVATYREIVRGTLGTWWSVAALPPGRTPRSIRLSLERGESIALPALNAIALRFPHDCALPHLAGFADPLRAANRIEACLEQQGSISSVTAQSLSYKPMRRLVVAYSVTGADGETSEWVGKCSRAATDERTRANFQAWADTRVAVASTDFEIAAPEGRIDEWSAMLWPRISGGSFLDYLRWGRAVPAAERIGAALGEIQCSGVVWRTRHRAQDEVELVVRWRDALRSSLPDIAALVERAAARLERRTVATTTLVPCHRDFYDKQWLLASDRATLVDLDTACLAEPELDVGNFSAHLTLRGLQYPGLEIEEPRRAFFEGYLRRAGRLAFDRLTFYEASALVRLACVYGLRGRGRDLVAGLADAALTALGVPSGERRSILAI